MTTMSIYFTAFVHEKAKVIHERDTVLKLLADEKSRSKTCKDELQSKLATAEPILKVRDVFISELVEEVKDQQSVA